MRNYFKRQEKNDNKKQNVEYFYIDFFSHYNRLYHFFKLYIARKIFAFHSSKK